MCACVRACVRVHTCVRAVAVGEVDVRVLVCVGGGGVSFYKSYFSQPPRGDPGQLFCVYCISTLCMYFQTHHASLVT